MKFLDHSFSTPYENLACDEALLDLCEEKKGGEILRVWEAAEYFVALGYSNQAETETRADFCRKNRIPILRRASGGGTVLLGPGCLNYSLVLQIEKETRLKNISETNRCILSRHAEALADLSGRAIEYQGISDLTAGGLKFSGNAQRRKRRAILFHGTFLLDFDLSMIAKALPPPGTGAARRPAYRKDRPHENFLTNLNLHASKVKTLLRRVWNADGPPPEIPAGKIRLLVADRYSQDDWNFKF